LKNYSGSTESNYALNGLQHFRLWIDDSDENEHQRKQAELDNSLRFKLLQARKENIPYFKDYKRVPAYDYLVRKEHGVFKVKIRLFVCKKKTFLNSNRVTWLDKRKQLKTMISNNNILKLV